MVMEGSGQQHLLFGEADLLHVGRQIPVVRIATDLSVSKLDDCGTANLIGGLAKGNDGHSGAQAATTAP